MWQRNNTAEFERAVSDGVLQERHDFDVKRELPNSGKELARTLRR
jgi:hypothetical protein